MYLFYSIYKAFNLYHCYYCQFLGDYIKPVLQEKSKVNNP